MKQRGFTLLELISTLCLTVVMSVLMLASWMHFKEEKEAAILIQDIKTAIQYAKNKAVNESRTLVLVPLEHNWSSGMKLIDPDILKEEESTLHQWRWFVKIWQLKWQGFSGDEVLYISGQTNALTNGQFVLEQKVTHKQIKLTLNRIGRIKES
ncbi:MAG: hypothetical protein CK426_04090 [Legionella sp.]|nr:MAG: hypothetical protein CK423_03090 [Legionella sp.]PJD99006.1 MAG: hypothetical protein CK426_04090 [Legionella sp.]